MAILSGIIGGANVARKAGLDFKGITSGIGGLFGGGNEPNAGNESFVDALDNYEKISTSRARLLQNEIAQAVRAGANDRRVGQLIASAGGYSVNDVMGSWKWKIITRFVDDIRAQEQNRSREPESVPAGVSGRSGGGVVSGGGGMFDGSGGGTSQALIWGAVGLVMIFAFQGLK